MSDDSAETERLLKLAASGDASAIDRLFGRHIPRIRGHLHRRIPRGLRSRFDESDIVSEAHWAARQRLAIYLARRPMPFSAWFLRTAYQRLIDEQRRHHRAARRSVSREVPFPDGSSWLNQANRHLKARPAAGELADHHEQVECLRLCLQQLTADDRRVIELRIFGTQSNEQVAAALNISPAAAKKRFTRALVRLKKIMPRDVRE
ncbi:MAG: sigma-70 family RNA polymerase sigma factor [Pirellulales bacterium]